MAHDRTYFRGGRLQHGGGGVDVVVRKQMADAADWKNVASSNVKAICWREGRGLMVWFDPKGKGSKSTGKETMYCYGGAPLEELAKMLAAPSKGGYLHEVIIPKYGHTEGPLSPEA